MSPGPTASIWDPQSEITFSNADVTFFSQVFKNLKLFMENKQEGDDLFDRLSVSPSHWPLLSLPLTRVRCERRSWVWGSIDAGYEVE